MFISRTLASSWYRDQVFQTIPSNLEGMARWNAFNIAAKKHREAYVDVAKNCIRACKEALDIRDALQKLYSIRNQVEIDYKKGPVTWRFWKWSDSEGAARFRLMAVDHCLEIVRNVRDRYLEH